MAKNDHGLFVTCVEECDKTTEVPTLGYSVPQPRFELNVHISEWSVKICNGETDYRYKYKI